MIKFFKNHELQISIITITKLINKLDLNIINYKQITEDLPQQRYINSESNPLA